MFCPDCGSEYVPGVTDCPDCGVALVEAAPVSAAAPVGEPVVVFRSGRQDLIAMAKSMLISAQIPFVARGEGVQDLFGWGRFPVGSNVAMGPMDILVSARDELDAIDVLSGLAASAPALSPDSVETGAEPPGELRAGRWWRVTRRVAIVLSAVVLGLMALEMIAAAVSAFSTQ